MKSLYFWKSNPKIPLQLMRMKYAMFFHVYEALDLHSLMNLLNLQMYIQAKLNLCMRNKKVEKIFCEYRKTEKNLLFRGGSIFLNLS